MRADRDAATIDAQWPWGIGATVVWGGIAILPLVIIPSWFESPTVDAAITILANLFTLVVVVAAARLAGWQAREYLALSRPTVRDVLLGIGAKTALLLASFVVLSGIGALSVVARADPDARFEWIAYYAAVALVWAANVVVGPICEEVCWRGFVYRGLASALGPAGAIIVMSPIFAVLHLYGPFGTFWVFLSAILYGWLRWRTQSLTAPIAAHAFGNGVATTFWTFGS